MLMGIPQPLLHSAGPWENMNKGDVMNVVARSNYRDMVITGDSCGHLRLYKYPSTTIKVEGQSLILLTYHLTAKVRVGMR